MNSFKRIAIGLAAALSISTLSVIPTNAAVNADTFSIDAVADTVEIGTSATAVLTVGFLAQGNSDAVTITSSVTSLPTGAAQIATFTTLETSTASVALGAGNYSAVVSSTSTSVAAVSAKLTATLATPSVAGTYVLKFIPSVAGVVINSAPVIWTVTVVAPDLKPSASTTTSILNAGETVSATSDAIVYASKSVSTDAAAVVVVTQKNAANGTAHEAMTATVTGPGLIGVGSNATTLTAQGRALTVLPGQHVGIFADGTAGTGTITITSVSGVVLGTEKVTFYGDIAKIVATSDKAVIALGSNVDAISAVAYDAQGVIVGSGTLYATSSDLTTVNNSAVSATIVNGVAKFSANGVKAGNANIVVSVGTTTSAPTAIRVEGTASKVKIAFDKAEYLPGEAATITVSVLDEAGLLMSPKAYTNLFATGGILSSYAFGATSEVITSVAVTTDLTSVKTYKVFMPLAQGDVKITAIGGISLPTAGQVEVSATAKVFDKNAQASLEAAQDAQAAAEAATEAALTAAEAADAATTAAQDASDAVAALSTQVTEWINALKVQNTALKAQLTALTNLVIKIQKKIKA
jgi:hypothetical protein